MKSNKNLSEIVFSKKLFIIYLATYLVPFFTSWIAFELFHDTFIKRVQASTVDIDLNSVNNASASFLFSNEKPLD